MEQSFAYGNVVMVNNETIEISMNDEIMEENVSVQTKTNKNPKNAKEEEMKINLKKLHAQKKMLALSWKIVFVLEFLLSQ
jgi:hypothetical protein